MSLLFEGAVLIAWVHDRRKERREAAESFRDLPDDVASPLDLEASPVDPVDQEAR
jgi:sec-independent protein translocase protein TatC